LTKKSSFIGARFNDDSMTIRDSGLLFRGPPCI